MTEDTTLTETERRYAYEHFGDDDEHCGRCYLEGDVESIVAARVAEARTEAAAVIEGFRRQNPMNGDGSNYTIDRILTALVGPDELGRLKREHQDRWNTEYLAFLERTGQSIAGDDQ